MELVRAGQTYWLVDKAEAVNSCTPAAVFQLSVAALSILLAVLWLETHWVRIGEDSAWRGYCGCAAEARLAQCFGGACRAMGFDEEYTAA